MHYLEAESREINVDFDVQAAVCDERSGAKGHTAGQSNYATERTATNGSLWSAWDEPEFDDAADMWRRHEAVLLESKAAVRDAEAYMDAVRHRC